MRAIMAAALISVALTLALTLAVYRPAWTEPEATETPESTPTPVQVLPIEIIDGEIWVAIPVDGVPTKGMEE